MANKYHIPVMPDECIEGLAINPKGIYVDLTFGGGGHSERILEKLAGGKLYAFDQDQAAKANARKIEDSSFTFIEANFRFVKRYLKLHDVTQVDGILADLGVSSHQIDEPERGFSTRFDGLLDMRMDRGSGRSAQNVVNEYSERELHRVLGMYGEVRNAKTLAAAIVSARTNKPVNTVAEFKEILQKFSPRGKENKYYAQVFQAIRIEVNEELKALEEMLVQTPEILRPKGRLVVLSYHSLEDRLVKNFMSKGTVRGEVEKDFYGNLIRPLQPLGKKPVEAKEDEIAMNSRARSAKLRIAEKL